MPGYRWFTAGVCDRHHRLLDQQNWELSPALVMESIQVLSGMLFVLLTGKNIVSSFQVDHLI